MFKKIKKVLALLLTAIFFYSTQVLAQSETLKIYIPYSGGSISDMTCRILFENYSNDHKTKVSFLNYPSTNQIIGHREFIKSTGPAVFCAGSGIVFNQVYEKNTTPALSTIRPVTNLLKFTNFILVPESSPNTFEGVVEEARKKNKSLVIGAPAFTSKFVLTYVLDQLGVKYKVILYNIPQEAIGSLKDASLDMYVDGGSIKQAGNITGIKEIAHASISNNISKTQNLIEQWPEIENVISQTTIYSRAEVSDAEVEQLSNNIRQTLASSAMKEYFNKTVPFHSVTPTTPKQTEEKIKKLLEFINAQQ